MDLDIKYAINENCPWSGNPIDEVSLTTYKGQVVGFCNTGCRDKFEKAIDLFDELPPAPWQLPLEPFTTPLGWPKHSQLDPPGWDFCSKVVRASLTGYLRRYLY